MMSDLLPEWVQLAMRIEEQARAVVALSRNPVRLERGPGNTVKLVLREAVVAGPSNLTRVDPLVD